MDEVINNDWYYRYINFELQEPSYTWIFYENDVE